MRFNRGRCNIWQTLVVLQITILFGTIITAALLGCSRSPSATSTRSAQEAVALASRAELLFQESKFDEGIATLLRAIAANPNDAGRAPATEDSHTLDQEKLQYGERQLKQMLIDRPAMAMCLKPGDSLWNWAVRKFAGEDSGELIAWDNKDPTPLDSDSLFEGGEIWLQGRGNEERSSEYECDALWARVIFELYRSSLLDEQEELIRRVGSGDIGCDQFVLGEMAITERARELTRHFYLKQFAPMRLASGATSLWPEEWHCYRFFSSEAEREKAWRSDVRWNYFANFFKILRFARQPNRDWALEFLEEVKAQEGSLTVGLRTALYSHLAIFHFENGNRSDALKALDVAEQIWPGSRAAQQCRTYIATANQPAEASPPSDGQLVGASPDEDLAISPTFLANRAARKFIAHDINGAVTDLLSAVELNPNDAGKKWDERIYAEIPPEQFSQGEKQLRAMLNDRPAMAKFVSSGDEIWTWAARQFAGEATGQIIEWDPGDPSPYDAHCRPARNGRAPAIQLRNLENDQALSAAEQFNSYWSSLAFEFYNLSYGAGNNLRVISDALEGKLTRDEYIVEILASEQTAAQCSRMFYLTTFLPYVQAKGLTVAPERWQCFTFFRDEAERLNYFQSLPHWEFYGNYYDRLMAANPNKDLQRAYQLQNEGKHKEALEIINDVVDAHPNSTNGLYMRGCLKLQEGKIDDALRDFDKGLAIDAGHALLLYARGQAYAQLGRFDEALNDYTASIEAKPNLPHAYYGRARAVLDNPQRDEAQLAAAVEDARQACELTNWESAEFLTLLSQAYSAINDADGVRSVEQKLEALQPKPQSGIPSTKGSL